MTAMGRLLPFATTLSNRRNRLASHPREGLNLPHGEHQGDRLLMGNTKGIDVQLAEKLRRMLLRLDNGPLPEAMALPAYRLHQLRGAIAKEPGRSGRRAISASPSKSKAPTRRTSISRTTTSLKGGCMEMFNPPHPGEIIREDCLKPLNLSVTAAAKGLGVSRQSLSELLNGRNGISADMSLRLEMAGWGTAESWLRNQVTYDLSYRHLSRLGATRPPRA